jgi:hypothetical protein
MFTHPPTGGYLVFSRHGEKKRCNIHVKIILRLF